MMHRARIIGLALLALAVPQLAFGGEQQSAPATLSVSASLDGCGLAETAIVCQIDTSWNALDGAEYYTVSVTRPDGSVVDAGQSTGTSRSVFVPYVAAGTYSVRVAAWGTPPGEDSPEVLAREKAMSTDDAGAARGATRPSGDGPVRGTRDADPASNDDPDSGGDVVTEPPASEKPPCEDPADEEDDEDAEPAEEAPAEAEAAAAEADATAEQAEDPPPVCP